VKARIAIYSGTIPSTTFIERLIIGLTEQKFEILLFGKLKSGIRYTSKNIHIVGNQRYMFGLIQTCFRIFVLRLFHSSRFRKLKLHLGYGPFSSRRGFLTWQKFVPVIISLPDIFHIQWAKNVKLILSLRGAHINYSPLADKNLANMYRNSFPKLDAFHAVSKAIAIEAELYGASANKIFVIYSGLKLTTVLPKYEVMKSKLRILTVGRFHWKKGYHNLLTAIALLKENGQSVVVTLIAQGEMPEEILFQLHDLNLVENVIWIKGLPHEDVLKKMKQHDVLVLPSSEEGVANVVIEAMNEGLPVITTDCGGMSEVVINDVNGLIVPVRNPQALAEALSNFSELRPNKIDQLRKNAHQTIANQFNIEKSMIEFAEMYNKVLRCE
jgi:glycosyltransferase involved in cell wall biosynthesis